jgi:hypothetical protein
MQQSTKRRRQLGGTDDDSNSITSDKGTGEPPVQKPSIWARFKGFTQGIFRKNRSEKYVVKDEISTAEPAAKGTADAPSQPVTGEKLLKGVLQQSSKNGTEPGVLKSDENTQGKPEEKASSMMDHFMELVEAFRDTRLSITLLILLSLLLILIMSILSITFFIAVVKNIRKNTASNNHLNLSAVDYLVSADGFLVGKFKYILFLVMPWILLALLGTALYLARVKYSEETPSIISFLLSSLLLYGVVVLIGNYVVIFRARKRMKGIRTDIRTLNAHIMNSITTNTAFHTLLRGPIPRNDVDRMKKLQELTDRIKNDKDPDHFELARKMYAVTMYTHLLKLGVQNDHTESAIKETFNVFNMLLERRDPGVYSPSDFLFRKFSYIEPQDAYFASVLNGLTGLSDATTEYEKRVGMTNNMANSINPGQAAVHLAIMAFWLLLIQTFPLWMVYRMGPSILAFLARLKDVLSGSSRQKDVPATGSAVVPKPVEGTAHKGNDTAAVHKGDETREETHQGGPKISSTPTDDAAKFLTSITKAANPKSGGAKKRRKGKR